MQGGVKMHSPDFELEIHRDDNGRVTGVAYRANAGEGSMKAVECHALATTALEAMFASEGPEDHSTIVGVDFSFPAL